MGFLAYQLLYVQLPLIVFPFPKEDFRYFSWVENTPSIGLYSYNEGLLTHFENQNYITRSILGEEDLFLISGQQKYDSIPRSYLRLVNGNYKLLQLHFDRKFERGACSGGLFGFRESGTVLKGYGSFSLPFIFNGNISASIYEDIMNFSVNCDHLFFETTKDRWYGYLKLGDARFGVTGDDRQFASYLLRLRDPIFMIMVNFVGEGLFEGNSFEMKDFFVAPIYVLSLDNSVYCVISEDLDSSVVGLKSRYAGLEVGKESCLLAVNSNLLKAFVDYSYDDRSFKGVVEGTLKYPLYHKKITPGVQVTYYSRPYDFVNPEKFDLELSLKILEVEFFWEMTGITPDDWYYEMQLWGMDMFFSF
jgi:hypothetical protein